MGTRPPADLSGDVAQRVLQVLEEQIKYVTVGIHSGAAVAIGAYVPPEIMRAVHVTPEEAVQVAEDARARVLLGVHWGTFDLAEEPLGEPPVRMLAEARRRGLPESRAWILKVGETRAW